MNINMVSSQGKRRTVPRRDCKIVQGHKILIANSRARIQSYIQLGYVRLSTCVKKRSGEISNRVRRPPKAVVNRAVGGCATKAKNKTITTIIQYQLRNIRYGAGPLHRVWQTLCRCRPPPPHFIHRQQLLVPCDDIIYHRIVYLLVNYIIELRYVGIVIMKSRESLTTVYALGRSD